MSTSREERIDWDYNLTSRGIDVVRYQRPRCPACGSEKLRARRSINQGDGSMLRYTTCTKCEKKFAVVAE